MDNYKEGKRYWWLNEESQQVLNRGYLLKGESVENAIDRVVKASSEKLPKEEEDYSSKIKEIIEKGWMSLSSPIWANMGTGRGLPISCFNVHVPDNVEGITNKTGEVIMQTKIGGGTSGYFGELRGRGSAVTDNGKSSGAVSFMKLFDTVMEVVSQGGVRRGGFAGYLDIDHPDSKEFLHIKDIGNSIQNLFTGVCVPDYWMKEMIEGDLEKRELWAKVLESRQEKGLPYIFFTDTINKNKPDIYKKLKLNINSSNLCSEITLPSSVDESFVCCLSSMNLELYDEWKDTDAVKYAVYFLDSVMSEFIEKTKDNHYLTPAHNFAKRHRAIGLGAMGWHSYLQKNMIPFEGLFSMLKTTEIFKNIKNESKKASLELAKKYGPTPIFKEVEDNLDFPKYRNTTTMAIAPTTSSSAILGQVSPGIEPFSSNYFKAGLAKGNFVRRNKYLNNLLDSKEKNDEDIWRSIMENKGSVQHLDFLTKKEKDVFKTFKEISQIDIINQASVRQKFIDQSQSLNLNIPTDLPIKEVNKLLIEAWKSGVKTLYYQRSQSIAKEMLSNIVSCSSCEA